MVIFERVLLRLLGACGIRIDKKLSMPPLCLTLDEVQVVSAEPRPLADHRVPHHALDQEEHREPHS
jgi:hypothetical protein